MTDPQALLQALCLACLCAKLGAWTLQEDYDDDDDASKVFAFISWVFLGRRLAG